MKKHISYKKALKYAAFEGDGDYNDTIAAEGENESMNPEQFIGEAGRIIMNLFDVSLEKYIKDLRKILRKKNPENGE